MVPDLQEDETFWPAVDASALRVRHPVSHKNYYIYILRLAKTVNVDDMEIKRFEFNLFWENTYLIWDGATREAAVADPGIRGSRRFPDFVSQLPTLQAYQSIWHAVTLHIGRRMGLPLNSFY